MNVIITGASAGIGFEIAKVFARKTDFTLIVIARSQDKLALLKEECLKINPFSKVIAIPFDLTKSDFTPLFFEIQKHVGSVNYLINNSGILINKTFSETTDRDLFDTFNVNVFSVFKIIQLLSAMFVNPSHIVNIGSMGGFQGSIKLKGLSAYSASKAALASFTECLAEEFKTKGIKVNCLALGSVQTEMLDLALPGYKANVSAIEMAGFIVDFTINGHNFFNGKILPVSSNTL